MAIQHQGPACRNVSILNVSPRDTVSHRYAPSQYAGFYLKADALALQDRHPLAQGL